MKFRLSDEKWLKYFAYIQVYLIIGFALKFLSIKILNDNCIMANIIAYIFYWPFWLSSIILKQYAGIFWILSYLAFFWYSFKGERESNLRKLKNFAFIYSLLIIINLLTLTFLIPIGLFIYIGGGFMK